MLIGNFLKQKTFKFAIFIVVSFFAFGFSNAKAAAPVISWDPRGTYLQGHPSGIGLIPAGTTSVQFWLLTDVNSICKDSTQAGVSFDSMTRTFSLTGNSSPTYHVEFFNPTDHPLQGIPYTSGGQTGIDYKYFVKCQNMETNEVSDDFPIEFIIFNPKVQTPYTDPLPGSYPSGTVINLKTDTSDADIHCEWDGSLPTINSPVCTYITLTQDITLKLIAVKSGMNVSDVYSGNFTVATTVSKPVASPAGNSYSSVQSVTLSSTTPGATILYTTDGTLPDSSSTRKTFSPSTPIIIAANTRLMAVATAPGYNESPLMTEDYFINETVVAPVIPNPAATTFTSPTSVRLSTLTSGASIYYSTDGSAPSSTSPTSYLYNDNTPISISKTTTLKAVAVKSGLTSSAVYSGTYTINLTVSNITPAPIATTYDSAQAVTLTTTTDGADIYYTKDGTTPDNTKIKYVPGSPIIVRSTTTIKAIAIKAGWTSSAQFNGTYTINETKVGTPYANIDPDTYTVAQTITLASPTLDATIYYTLDNTTPDQNSLRYVDGSSITISATKTIKAIAIKTGLTPSDVFTGTYVISQKAETPYASPVANTYNGEQTITLTSNTSDASIYYTLDGTTPGISSNLYGGPFKINTDRTIRAIAIKAGMLPSDVFSGTYLINLPGNVATPVSYPDGGTFIDKQTISLTSSTPGAVIHYTLDGSTPTASSTTYTTPFTISTSKTLKAIAIRSRMPNSEVLIREFSLLSQYFSQAEINFSDNVKNGKTNERDITLEFSQISSAIKYKISTDSSFKGEDWIDIGEPAKVHIRKNKKQTITYYIKFQDKTGAESEIFKKRLKYSPPKRTVKNSLNYIKRGQILIQSGKAFSKNNLVRLYFSKPGGGYYAPSLIKADKNGNFSTSYIVNKPAGNYSWYAEEVKSGRQSKIIYYTVQ